jgi:hypothetical protein
MVQATCVLRGRPAVRRRLIRCCGASATIHLAQMVRSVARAIVAREESSMSITRFLIGAIVLVSVPLAACDQSRPELEATKQRLQAMSTEHEGLKAQLDASKQQTAALQQQVNVLQAKLAAAAAALAAEPKPDAGKGEKGDKKGAAGGKTGSAKPSETAKPSPAP